MKNRRYLQDLLGRAAAAAGLLALSPALAMAAAAVWIEGGFPVLFRHVRVGRGGRKFALLKFRTMRKNARGLPVTAGGDPRITRVGRFLRRYKIDELPQLWNVLRGEMALVGPRPEVPDYVDPNDPVWRAVLQERPGITDLATLMYRNEEEILAGARDPDRYYREVVLPAKLALNLRYARASSPASDLRLLAMTLRYSFLPFGFDPARIERAFAPRNQV